MCTRACYGGGAVGALGIMAALERQVDGRGFSTVYFRRSHDLPSVSITLPDIDPSERIMHGKHFWGFRIVTASGISPEFQAGDGVDVDISSDGGLVSFVVVAMLKGHESVHYTVDGSVPDRQAGYIYNRHDRVDGPIAALDCLVQIAPMGVTRLTVSCEVDPLRYRLVITSCWAQESRDVQTFPMALCCAWPGAMWQWSVVHKLSKLGLTQPVTDAYRRWTRIMSEDLGNPDMVSISSHILESWMEVLRVVLATADDHRLGLMWRPGDDVKFQAMSTDTKKFNTNEMDETERLLLLQELTS
jgi:hypothetical protein